MVSFISFLETQSLDTASISSQGGVLSHLVLSKNMLKDVPTRALRMLKNLDHLNLNDNQITSLHANAFEGLSKVIFFPEEKLIELLFHYNYTNINMSYPILFSNVGYKTLTLRK